MAVKVKPTESQEVKAFEVEIPKITWKRRCELNDLMISKNSNGEIPPFSFWGEVVLKFTKLSEEELNEYSTDEIISIANAVFEEANKKK